MAITTGPVKWNWMKGDNQEQEGEDLRVDEDGFRYGQGPLGRAAKRLFDHPKPKGEHAPKSEEDG